MYKNILIIILSNYWAILAYNLFTKVVRWLFPSLKPFQCMRINTDFLGSRHLTFLVWPRVVDCVSLVL
jgi:hypothetical protein